LPLYIHVARDTATDAAVVGHYKGGCTYVFNAAVVGHYKGGCTYVFNGAEFLN
jgi:hypothetical protein